MQPDDAHGAVPARPSAAPFCHRQLADLTRWVGLPEFPRSRDNLSTARETLILKGSAVRLASRHA